jgi:hypothetical protein
MSWLDIKSLPYALGAVVSINSQLSLEDGPAELQTIADVYREKVLPAALRDLNCTPLACWETGRSFTQENNEQIILVPSQEVSFPK